MVRYTYAVILVSLLSCLGIAQGPPVSAQSVPPSSLSVSPAILEQGLERGQTKEQIIEVTNITNVPLPISAAPTHFTPEEQVLGTANTALFNASTWFTVSPSDFILLPNETKEVLVTAEAPPNAEPGGHYATIYFNPLVPESDTQANTAYLHARIGVLAFLTVPGAITEDLSLGALKTGLLQQKSPFTFRSQISNQGNVHLLPAVKLEIYSLSKKLIESIPVAPSITLPGTIKPVSAEWNDRKSIGIYSAKLVVEYGAETKRLSATTYFMIFPWGYSVLFTLAFGIIAVFVWKTYGRWSNAWQALKGKSEK